MVGTNLYSLDSLSVGARFTCRSFLRIRSGRLSSANAGSQIALAEDKQSHLVFRDNTMSSSTYFRICCRGKILPCEQQHYDWIELSRSLARLASCDWIIKHASGLGFDSQVGRIVEWMLINLSNKVFIEFLQLTKL